MKRALALACLGLLAACSGSPGKPEPPAPVPVEAPAVAEPPAPPPPKAPPELTIAAVGDMMIGTEYPQDRLPDDDGLTFLSAVRPWLAAADIAVGNLEGVLADDGEPAKKCSNPNACWLFRSPTRYAWHYRAAGFDALSLANNHARDFGEEGRDASMAALSAAGIYHSGRQGSYASFRHGELDIAFIAFAVTKNSNMLLDYATAEAQVASLADRHDIVIVSFHGGAEGSDAINLPFADEEYYNEPRGDVVRFARSMVDHGADLVIGHGPHVVRAMENYKGRLIAYSLGNFATYYGISVAGIKGVAPILLVTLSNEGELLGGEIVSTRQIRPSGPTPDPTGRALRLIRQLTSEDFSDAGLDIHDDGTFTPAIRSTTSPRLAEQSVDSIEPGPP